MYRNTNMLHIRYSIKLATCFDQKGSFWVETTRDYSLMITCWHSQYGDWAIWLHSVRSRAALRAGVH
jgi:hypothetical protein